MPSLQLGIDCLQSNNLILQTLASLVLTPGGLRSTQGSFTAVHIMFGSTGNIRFLSDIADFAPLTCRSKFSCLTEHLLLIGRRKQRHQSRALLNVVYYQWNIPKSPLPWANDTNATHSCGFLEQAYFTWRNSLTEPEPKSANAHFLVPKLAPGNLSWEARHSLQS